MSVETPVKKSAITTSPTTSSEFNKDDVIPPSLYERITTIRITEPQRILERAHARLRNEHVAPDGRLSIVAADHPARFVTKAGDDALVMADRHDYLARLVHLLKHDAVDGVMASMDILEELFIIDSLYLEEKKPSFLNNKLMMVSLNRGGLAGSAWELDDPLTGPSAKSIRNYRLDGSKLLLRVDLHHADSLKTMMYCQKALKKLTPLDLPIFLEPLPVHSTQNENGTLDITLSKNPDDYIRLIGVASALGEASRNLWLKLPVVGSQTDMARIAGATTLPIVLLGGGKSDTPTQVATDLMTTMQSAHNICGLMLGRNLMFPNGQKENPLPLAATLFTLCHDPKLRDYTKTDLSEKIKL